MDVWGTVNPFSPALFASGLFYRQSSPAGGHCSTVERGCYSRAINFMQDVSVMDCPIFRIVSSKPWKRRNQKGVFLTDFTESLV